MFGEKTDFLPTHSKNTILCSGSMSIGNSNGGEKRPGKDIRVILSLLA